MQQFYTHVQDWCLVILKRWDWIWLLEILWNWGGQQFLKFSFGLRMTSILFSNSDFSSMGYSKKGIYEAWYEKICEYCESSFFCWDSSIVCASFILFSNSNFFSIGGLEKEYRKQNWGMNILRIMDKVVENLTGGG